jgi:hypothetical protein
LGCVNQPVGSVRLQAVHGDILNPDSCQDVRCNHGTEGDMGQLSCSDWGEMSCSNHDVLHEDMCVEKIRGDQPGGRVKPMQGYHRLAARPARCTIARTNAGWCLETGGEPP